MNRKARVIRFHRTGGPDVLQIDKVELPPLKNNEVLLKMDALAISRADILITYWNRGAQELYGRTAEEAIGKRAHELWQSVLPAPIDAIRELGIFWATINQPPPGSIETYQPG